MLIVNITTCGNAPRKWGQMTSHSSWPGMTTDRLTIFRQSAVAEHVDRPLLDGQVGRALRRLDAQRHHQRPRRAAVGHRDSVRRQLIIPVAHPRLYRDIALAARRRHGPLLGLAPGKKFGVER